MNLVKSYQPRILRPYFLNYQILITFTSRVLMPFFFLPQSWLLKISLEKLTRRQVWRRHVMGSNAGTWEFMFRWIKTPSPITVMTSSNGNIFRVTGPLCGEFTGPGEFPTQRPVTRSFDAFFELRLNKRLSKQPWGWWLETPSWSLWRQCNDIRSRMVQQNPERRYSYGHNDSLTKTENVSSCRFGRFQRI